MKNLFTIDLKDYDSTWQTFVRPSVRGIILKEENKIAMVYSQKYHYYKFPGGGIEKNESHKQTLAREIKEETGMTLIPESVMEFGKVSRIQKKDDMENIIFYQENYYYTCKTEPEIKMQELDEDEKELVRIFRTLGRRERHEFMSTAYEFEKQAEIKGDTGTIDNSAV